MKTIKNFINAIREEKEGFSFGDPWRFDEASLVAVLPVLRQSREKRNYIVLAEAKKFKIEDTGNINSVLITNEEKEPIFVRAGEIFKGKTQERATTISRVVMPGKTEKIDVVCVHQSKGIVKGTTFERGGFAPASVNVRESQSEVWANSVNFMSSAQDSLASLREVESISMGVGSASWGKMDDLTTNIKEFSKAIETILKKVPFAKNQVGIVLLDTQGCAGLEAFNLSQSWKALKDDVIQREGEKISEVDKEGVFEYKPKKAKETTKKTLRETFEESTLYKDKDTQTIGISHGDFIGEATILKNKVIHLNLTRSKGKKNKERG